MCIGFDYIIIIKRKRRERVCPNMKRRRGEIGEVLFFIDLNSSF
jgi:hypothetical protein